MQIVTVQFNYKGRPDYGLLLDVFRYSVKKYMPNVKFIEIKIEAPINKTGRQLNFNYNDVKLKYWRDFMENATDDTIFADCDMLALQSAEHAFDIPFDVAATFRTVKKRIPMNGGIICARPTEAAKRFFREWYQINHRMLHNKPFHQEWRRVWAGMNQAAFGYVFKKGKHCARIHRYMTREWNAVDCDWNHLYEKTVFLHIKSKLRKLVLAKREPFGIYKRAMEIWYNMHCEAIGGKIRSQERLLPRPRKRPRSRSRIKSVKRVKSA